MALAHRVLVVDDEPHVRFLVERSLRDEGFNCDQANDGAEAASLIQNTKYDVLVTDLRMPGRHGHALVCDALAMPEPPLVVVLTGCLEPKLIKDLLARGVDDVVFKPVDFRALAGKLRALVNRRSASTRGHMTKDGSEAESAGGLGSVSREEYDQKLGEVMQILSLSPFAMDVFHLTNSGTPDAGELAALVLRDGVLTAELLRLANSAFYNPSSNPITNVTDAIIRVGFRRVGGLALATSTRSALTDRAVAWLNADLMASRSMAAVVAAAHLEEQGSLQGVGDGPFLGALMHPLGRVVLGMQFPQHYEHWLRWAKAQLLPLREIERQYLPENHSAALARVLRQWNLSTDLLGPLRHAADPFDAVARLPDPDRLKAEMVKVSIVIARFAIGIWQPWDLVEFPTEEILQRLHLRDMHRIISLTRDDVRQIERNAGISVAAQKNGQKLGTIRYCSLAENRFDCVRLFFTTLGYELDEVSIDYKHIDGNLVVNCLGAPAPGAMSRIARTDPPRRLLIMDDRNDRSYRTCGEVLSVPASYGAIARAITRYAIA